MVNVFRYNVSNLVDYVFGEWKQDLAFCWVCGISIVWFDWHRADESRALLVKVSVLQLKSVKGKCDSRYCD